MYSFPFYYLLYKSDGPCVSGNLSSVYSFIPCCLRSSFIAIIVVLCNPGKAKGCGFCHTPSPQNIKVHSGAIQTCCRLTVYVFPTLIFEVWITFRTCKHVSKIQFPCVIVELLKSALAFVLWS